MTATNDTTNNTTNETGPIIVWFRKDLRLFDNPALARACQSGNAVVPVFILDDETYQDSDWAAGAASRWWLDASLRQLQASLLSKGLNLILRRGPALDCLSQLIQQTGAQQLLWNRCYEADGIARDREVKKQIGDCGVKVESFNAALLNEPWQIKTGAGKPYQVFTPYWKSVLRQGISRTPTPLPEQYVSFSSTIVSDELDDWQLSPVQPDWAGGMRESWQPGESGAWKQLNAFLDMGVYEYAHARDRPDQPGTSGTKPIASPKNKAFRNNRQWHFYARLAGASFVITCCFTTRHCRTET